MTWGALGETEGALAREHVPTFGAIAITFLKMRSRPAMPGPVRTLCTQRQRLAEFLESAFRKSNDGRR